MGYKTVIITDLCCDTCGKIYKNEHRSSNDVLLSKAFKDSWTIDNNSHIYCKECAESDNKVSLEVQFYWPNYYKMAIKLQSIQNIGKKEPIKFIGEIEGKLSIILDKDSTKDMDPVYLGYMKDIPEWGKTVRELKIIYPDNCIIYKNLICEDVLEYSDVNEFVFTFKEKSEKEF